MADQSGYRKFCLSEKNSVLGLVEQSLIKFNFTRKKRGFLWKEISRGITGWVFFDEQTRSSKGFSLYSLTPIIAVSVKEVEEITAQLLKEKDSTPPIALQTRLVNLTKINEKYEWSFVVSSPDPEGDKAFCHARGWYFTDEIARQEGASLLAKTVMVYSNIFFNRYKNLEAIAIEMKKDFNNVNMNSQAKFSVVLGLIGRSQQGYELVMRQSKRENSRASKIKFSRFLKAYEKFFLS